MGWGVWNKIKQGISKAFNWVKDKVVKPVTGFVRKIVAPIIGTKGQVMQASGNVLGKVLPGPLGQFAQTAGNMWGAVGKVADKISQP